MRRIITIFSILLAFSVSGLASAAQGKAELLTPALLEGAPQAVALYHPNNARSLQLLDQLAERSSGELLAICVGAGCTAEAAVRTAAQREWPFDLAYDPTGDISLEQLGMRSAGSVVSRALPAAEAPLQETLSTTAGMPLARSISSPLAQKATGTTAAAGALAPSSRPFARTMSDTPVLEAPALREVLFIAVPLALVGLGGAALVFGARRRREQDEDDETEAERIERYIRDKHGRKRTARR